MRVSDAVEYTSSYFNAIRSVATSPLPPLVVGSCRLQVRSPQGRREEYEELLGEENIYINLQHGSLWPKLYPNLYPGVLPWIK